MNNSSKRDKIESVSQGLKIAWYNLEIRCKEQKWIILLFRMN